MLHFAPASVATVVFLLAVASACGLYFGLLESRRDYGTLSDDIAAADGSRTALSKDGLRWGGTAGAMLEWWTARLAEADQKYGVRRLRGALTRAGFDRPEHVAIYLGARIATPAATIVMALIFAAFYPEWWAVALIGGALIGYLLPGYVLARLESNRHRTIVHELPAILDLLVVTLEAGLGLTEAIRIVGREAERQGRVLGKELATTSAEMSTGLSLEQSLRILGERTGVDDVKAIAAVLIQSKEIGGRMGPALRASAELLTEKRRMRAEEAAQKSSVKMLMPLVLLILPAMMIIILGPAMIQIFKLLVGAG